MILVEISGKADRQDGKGGRVLGKIIKYTYLHMPDLIGL
jgi:hypothetical protein